MDNWGEIQYGRNHLGAWKNGAGLAARIDWQPETAVRIDRIGWKRREGWPNKDQLSIILFLSRSLVTSSEKEELISHQRIILDNRLKAKLIQ